MTESSRHPVLERLNVLVGEWELTATINGQTVGGGWTTFEWIENGAYLLQIADRNEPPEGMPPEWAENSPEPVTTIIGMDDSSEQFTMLYADARNVFRVYQMDTWRVWRDAPSFSQRFTGTLSDDGRTIDGQWEMSEDGVNWNVAFFLTYAKNS